MSQKRWLMIGEAPSSMAPERDSNWHLCRKSQLYDIELHYTTPEQIGWQNGVLHAHVLEYVQLEKAVGVNDSFANAHKAALESYDVILMRQDPPFNMRYITLTYWLEAIADKVRVINPPKLVRDMPEKLAPQLFPQHCIETLMTHNAEDIAAFFAKHGDIVLKPLYFFGSRGVERVTAEEKLPAAIASVQSCDPQVPIIAQPTLPVHETGDIRAYFVHGEYVGAFKRVPNSNLQSSAFFGAEFLPHTLSMQEKRIAEDISPWLTEHEAALCGIDIIAERLTEINITCPSGLQFLEDIYKKDFSAMFFERLGCIRP